MNGKDVSRYYKLKCEIKDLEDRITEFGDGVGGIQFKDIIVSTSGVKSSIQEKLMKLKDEYMEKRISALEEYLRIEQFIGTIDDPEIRTIMRMRCLDLLTWNNIADKLSNEDRDITEDAVKKKYYRFFKNS